MLQRRHARRGLGLPVHDEELAAALRRPIANLGLNAKIERAASLRERLDGVRHEARAEAGERDIVKGDAREMRSADVFDLRPEARRSDRIVNETKPAAGRQMRSDNGKPVGIMQGQMGDADALVRRSPAPERSDARWRRQRHATAAHISGCRSSPMWTEAAARLGRWAETTDRSPSRSIRRRPRGTAPSPRSPCRLRRRAVSQPSRAAPE